LLLLIGVYILRGITGQLRELIEIFTNCHGTHLELLEFLALRLDLTSWYILSTKAATKLPPCDSMGILMSSSVRGPPVLRLALQLMGSIKDLVTSFTMGNL